MKTKAKKPKAATLLDFYERVYLPEHLKDRKPSYRQVFCRTVDRFVSFCRGDMLAIQRQQIEKCDGGHVLRTLQSKTGDGVIHRLHPATVAAVEALFPPVRELVFAWPYSVATLQDHWKDVLDHAGLDPLNRRNGVQKLRRTSASHLERQRSGAATAHLGHRSADMARLHYLDPKISRGELPLPPDLDS